MALIFKQLVKDWLFQLIKFLSLTAQMLCVQKIIPFMMALVVWTVKIQITYLMSNKENAQVVDKKMNYTIKHCIVANKNSNISQT